MIFTLITLLMNYHTCVVHQRTAIAKPVIQGPSGMQQELLKV